MESSVVESVPGYVNITPPKSARKRILFSRSPEDEGSDGTLGHMSPLSLSSPDRYSSPPPSPQWLLETPPKKCDQHWPRQSPFGPVKKRTETRKSPRLFSCDFNSSSLQKFPPDKIRVDNHGQDEIKGVVTDMELVEESPAKGPSKMVLVTPFKCLAGKEKEIEETPKLKPQKMVIRESPDIFPVAPVKVLQKAKSDNDSSTVLKPLNASTGVGKLSSLPTSSFYHTSRARAALFPEHFSKSRNTVASVIHSKNLKRSLNAESHLHMRFSLSSSKSKGTKRRKLGEINAGVHHRIKKHTKKKFTYKHPVDTPQPKITPEDRIHSYVDKFETSSTDTKNLVGTDAHSPSTHCIQTYSIGSNLKRSSISLTSDTMEPTPPSSPPPDPAKKFFKTQRTLKINTSATVTLEKNIKLKVSNGKFSLCKPVTKSKSCRMPKADISKYCLNKNNGIFTEKSTTEIVQETVHDNVEILLKNLEESPKKDNLPAVGDLQSPNHHIYAITTSTLSLAIDDDLPHQPLLQTAQTLSNPSSGSTFVASTAKIDSENMQKSQEEYLFAGETFTEHNAEKENGNKYYPVFYKTSANKLADLTNVKSLRGNKQSWRSIGDYQYIIDAGQKKFGATQCKECGIVYQIGDPDDEVFHQKYHNNGHDLKYTSWKHERVVAYYGSERVILIKPSDPKSWLNKVHNVLAIVDKELGYADSALEGLSNSQVYLYVMDKQVTGCVVAHQISFAFKMLNSVIEGCDCCSEESYPAKCGISRVWVAKNHRRKKIASRIMDCLRSSFIHGYMLGMDEFAFSAPTIDGKAFAEKYTGTMNYLVYS